MTDNIPVDRTEAADAARQPSRAPCSGGGPAATAAPVPVTETAANRQLPS